MNRNPVGRTSVRVTELGFGAAPIGNLYRAIDDETAHEAVVAAWDGGIRYYDTAPHYGLGLSERRLGAALAGKPRREYAVSTKVGRLLVPNAVPTGSDLDSGGFAVADDLTRIHDYSRDGVLRSLEASLTRLGMDRIDIVYVHDPENHLDQAIKEAIPALIELREQGVIGALGAGMNFTEPLLRIVTETDVDVVMLAGRWTLADRSGAPLLAACAERGVSVVAAAPFNSGLLASPIPPAGAFFNYEPATPEVLGYARRLGATCSSRGVSLPHAALQFPSRHHAVASVVAGMRNAKQVNGNVHWAANALPPALWNDLAALESTRPMSLRDK